MRLALRARPAVVSRDRTLANGSEAAVERGAAWRLPRQLIGRAINVALCPRAYAPTTHRSPLAACVYYVHRRHRRSVDDPHDYSTRMNKNEANRGKRMTPGTFAVVLPRVSRCGKPSKYPNRFSVVEVTDGRLSLCYRI